MSDSIPPKALTNTTTEGALLAMLELERGLLRIRDCVLQVLILHATHPAEAAAVRAQHLFREAGESAGQAMSDAMAAICAPPSVDGLHRAAAVVRMTDWLARQNQAPAVPETPGTK